MTTEYIQLEQPVTARQWFEDKTEGFRVLERGNDPLEIGVVYRNVWSWIHTQDGLMCLFDTDWVVTYSDGHIKVFGNTDFKRLFRGA